MDVAMEVVTSAMGAGIALALYRFASRFRMPSKKGLVQPLGLIDTLVNDVAPPVHRTHKFTIPGDGGIMTCHCGARQV